MISKNNFQGLIRTIHYHENVFKSILRLLLEALNELKAHKKFKNQCLKHDNKNIDVFKDNAKLT